MCNLYSLTTNQEAVRRLFGIGRDRTGNLPPLPGIFPNYAAPVILVEEGERALAMMKWGMPSPVFALKGRNVDRGVTNIRNTASPHWRRWLGPESRCLVPFTSFSENETLPDGSRPPVWFALSPERPIACFAGLFVRGWRSVRRVRDGETQDDLFGFLTTEPNAEIAPIHPKAMPVILTEPEQWEAWLRAPWPEAATLQQPLRDGVLTIVGRGAPQDPPAEAVQGSLF